MICTCLSFYTDIAAAECLRVRGIRFDDVCSTVALDVFISSWLDLLLLCTSHTHIHRDYHKSESLGRSCRCAAAAVLLYTAFVAAKLSGCLQKQVHRSFDHFVCLWQHTPHPHIYRSAHAYTHKHRPWLPQRSAAAAASWQTPG